MDRAVARVALPTFRWSRSFSFGPAAPMPRPTASAAAQAVPPRASPVRSSASAPECAWTVSTYHASAGPLDRARARAHQESVTRVTVEWRADFANRIW
ncbi:hypothetical protein GCM10010393_22300 [Streptomyces gobitricini]|uniref:Uncharacterized protein n=1 Tax=Streptomyces gobitricini TaxID=68211 RepID=A0ABP5Z1U0_9ACTN